MNFDNKEIRTDQTKEYGIFFSYCQEYFLEILFKTKEPNFIYNELAIIKNDEIRKVFFFFC